jgi:hypothetical protein
MIFMMLAWFDGTDLFEVSAVRVADWRGNARVLLDRQCKSGAVVDSHAAVRHTARRRDQLVRRYYGFERYLSEKPRECPRGYYADPKKADS